MACSDYLTILNIIVAFLGVLFVLVTIYEYWKLRTLRADFEEYRKQLAEDLYRSQRAQQQLIASYQITDPKQRIELATSAAGLDPDSFNVWNTIGWAWLELNEPTRSVEAFREAIRRHPNDKAGYFDLAYAYLKLESPGMALDALEQAVVKDDTSRHDLQGNLLFKELPDNPRYQRLFPPR